LWSRCLTRGLAFSGSSPSASDLDLRLSWKRAPRNWRSARRARNPTAWRSWTTTYRQGRLRNLTASQKQRYPDAVCSPAGDPAGRAQAGANGKLEAVGETAHLIDFGKIDLGLIGRASR